MTEPVATCPGYCCFDLGPIRFKDHLITLEELHELARDPAERGVRWFLEKMLIPLGKDKDGADHFSCNFFDREARTCTIYESRPKMCRDYPSAHQTCLFCTYDKRNPDVPGVLREELKDPERLLAVIERVKH
jgi:Fe-S-cluster containining protein